MSKVTIVYKKQCDSVEIDDISPEDLQECFNLSKPPKFLLDEKGQEFIHSKYWKEELKAGCTYRVKEDGNPLGKRNINEEESAKKNEINGSVRDVLSHSLIASRAVYNMEHDEDDEKSIRKYLYEEYENHSFEYIIPSKHGKNFYLIAKEKKINRIYIAFRGNKDLLDCKYNLQVTLCYLFTFIYFLNF